MPDDYRATWNSWEAIRDNAKFEMANIAARHTGTGKHDWSMMEMWRQDGSGKQWAGSSELYRDYEAWHQRNQLLTVLERLHAATRSVLARTRVFH